MLINISFYNASDVTEINPENYIPADKGNITNIQMDKINLAGKELESILNEDYFGGANGAEYAGFDLDNEVFNYKLIPG